MNAPAWTLALLLAAAAVPARAQSIRYIPNDSWMTPWIDHLVRSGALPDLDPLTRPYQRGEVASALEAGRGASGSDAMLAIMDMLARELEDQSGGARWTIDGEAGVLAASDASRWSLRPTTDSSGVFPEARVTASLELPHLALQTSPAIDNRLRYDPWYGGKKDRFVAGRANPAYALGSWRFADVFFGILDRSWGPREVEGLLMSDAPYATEHFFLRLGVPRLRLELVASQLDTVMPFDSSVAPERWFISHRLVIRPFSRLSIALEESMIYAGGGLPWRYLNPLALGVLTFYDDGPQPNSLLGVSVDLRVSAAARVYAQAAVDDIQVDDNLAGDREPPAYGLTIGGAGAIASASWTAFYTRVSNLMYRTPSNPEQFTVNGVGLARNFSDYDQLTARVGFVPAPLLLATADVSLLRQGEGDMRLRYPDISAFADSLTFLTGTVQRTWQLGATAHWLPTSRIEVMAHGSWRMTSNADHVAGQSVGRFVWRLRLRVRGRLSGALER